MWSNTCLSSHFQLFFFSWFVAISWLHLNLRHDVVISLKPTQMHSFPSLCYNPLQQLTHSVVVVFMWVLDLRNLSEMSMSQRSRKIPDFPELDDRGLNQKQKTLLISREKRYYSAVAQRAENLKCIKMNIYTNYQTNYALVLYYMLSICL